MIDQSIEEQAFSLLTRHKISQLPIPVEAIANAEGIQVVRQSSTGNESGFLLRDGHRTIIGLNSTNSDQRQRFTIAHELGHWRMHEGKPLIIDHAIKINRRNDLSSTATDKQEIEANAYAAALLMPSASVIQIVNQEVTTTNHTVDSLLAKLADMFFVSNDAMKWRLVNLGIIN